MFSKVITSSSSFLMMPQTAQALYFHFGMNADDDGFCEHFAIMRMVGANPDDLKILQAKKFVHVFDERVLVIRDWKENNYLRGDRYKESKYASLYKNDLALLSSESDNLSLGIPMVDHMATQDRIGKDRIGEKTTSSDDEKDSAYSKEFEEFYLVYPLKKGKGAAFRSFNRVSKRERPLLKDAIMRQVSAKHFRGSNGSDFVPHPATWLNQKRWEDEVEDKREVASKVKTY